MQGYIILLSLAGRIIFFQRVLSSFIGFHISLTSCLTVQYLSLFGVPFLAIPLQYLTSDQDLGTTPNCLVSWSFSTLPSHRMGSDG